MFSHHWDLHEIQFLCSPLHFYHLGILQSNLTTFMQGKKMKHKKNIKTFSKVLRSLTKQKIEVGCLCPADGTCTSHSLKHHQVGQQLHAQDAFHAALPRCEKLGKGMVSLSCCFPGKVWSPPLLTATLQIPKAFKDPNLQVNSVSLPGSSSDTQVNSSTVWLTDVSASQIISSRHLWPSSAVGPKQYPRVL